MRRSGRWRLGLCCWQKPNIRARPAAGAYAAGRRASGRTLDRWWPRAAGREWREELRAGLPVTEEGGRPAGGPLHRPPQEARGPGCLRAVLSNCFSGNQAGRESRGLHIHQARCHFTYCINRGFWSLFKGQVMLLCNNSFKTTHLKHRNL